MAAKTAIGYLSEQIELDGAETPELDNNVNTKTRAINHSD